MEKIISDIDLKRALKKIIAVAAPVSILLLLFWATGVEATTLSDSPFRPLGNVSIPEIIGRVIRAMLGLAGVIALLMFIYSGVTWMIAQGNTEKVSKAKNTLVWSVLGLIIIFSSYAVVGLVIGLLGQS